MLKTLVTNLVDKYLGDYIIGSSIENLTVDVGSGQINLQNVEINPNALLEINLPMKIKKGTLGSVKLDIPWANMTTKPTNIQIEDLCLLIVPKIDELDENLETILESTKQKKLKVNEMFHIDENISEPQKEKRENETWVDHFIEKIVEKFMNNLEIDIKRIHIRYEDDSSNKGESFSFGLTLDHLQGQSADENWIPSVFTEKTTVFHKLFTLKGLAIYWNSNDRFVEWEDITVQGSINSFAQAMINLIPSDEKKPNHHYILEPVDSILKVVYKKQEILDMHLPTITMNFFFDKIGVCINEAQYKNLLTSADFYARIVKSHKYKHLKPKDLPNNKKDYKKWWHYLVDSVLLEYRENKKVWKWEFLKQHLSDRKQYIDLWYKKRAKLEYDEDLLEEMEDRLSYETIVSFRELGDTLYFQQKARSEQKANEENAKKTFLGKLLFPVKPKLEENVEISPEVVQDLTEKLEDDNKKDNFIVDYIKMGLVFEIKKMALQVQKTSEDKRDFEPILKFEVDNLLIDTKLRQNSKSFLVSLGQFSAVDYFTSSGKPINTISPTKTEKDLLVFEFHSDPLKQSYNAETKIVLDVQSFDIFFSMKLVDRISNFFQNPVPENSMVVDSLATSTKKRMHSLQDKTELKILTAMNSKKKVDINVNISAPRIHLLEDPSDEDSTKLVIDLGKIHFSSDLNNHRQSLIKEGDELKVSIDYFYEKYDLKLTGIRLSLITNEMNVSKIKEPDVVDSMSIDVSLRLLNNPVGLPKIMVSTEFITPISSSISANRITHIMKILGTLSIERDVDQKVERKKTERYKLKAFQTVEKKKNDKVDRLRRFLEKFRLSLAEFLDQEENTELLDNLRKNNIHFDCEEFSNPRDPTQLCFSMVVPSVKLLLYKSSHDQVQKLVNCELKEIFLKFEQKKNSSFLDSSISAFSIKDRIQQYGKEYKRIVDSNISNNGKELVSLKYEGLPKTSPFFKGIEHNLALSFSGLSVMLNRETLVHLLKFLDEINSKQEAIIEKIENNKPEKAKIKASQISDKDLVLAGEREEERYLMLKLVVDIGSLRGSLNGEGYHSLIFLVGSSKADVEVSNNRTISVVSSLGRLEVIDGLEIGAYSKVLSTDLDNTLTLRYDTFNPLSDSYQGYDSKVDIHISSIKAIFLNKFLDNLVNYFAEMGEMLQRLDSSSKRTKDKKEYGDRKNQMVEIFMSNPVIVIPKKSSSKKSIVVDLGEISVKMFDGQNEGESVNIIEAAVTDMNVKMSDSIELENKSYIIEDTTMKVTVERVIEASVQAIPSMSIIGSINKFKLNLSDFSVGMVVGVLEGNLCEKGKKTDLLTQPIKNFNAIRDKEETKIKGKALWEDLYFDFSINELCVSFAKDGDFGKPPLELALLDINKMLFTMKNRTNHCMKIEFSLNEILLFDKSTNNSKFPKLFTQLPRQGDSKLIIVHYRKDEAGNQNISIVLEDIRVQLVTEPILQLNTWLVPLFKKFLDETYKKKSPLLSRDNLQLKLSDSKIEKVSSETKLSVGVTILKPEIVLIDNHLDENSSVATITGVIFFTFESGRKKGMSVGLNVNNFSVSKCFFGENNDPVMMVEPWDINASYSDTEQERKIRVVVDNVTTSFSYQDYRLLLKFRELLLNILPKKDDEKKEKELEVIIEEKEDISFEYKNKEGEDVQQDKLTTALVKTGKINLTLVDDTNNQNDPVILLMLQSGTAELTKKGETIHGVLSAGVKLDYFNSVNQNWEPLLRSISGPREGTLSREGRWVFNALIKREEEYQQTGISLTAQTALNISLNRCFLVKMIQLHQSFKLEEKRDNTSSPSLILENNNVAPQKRQPFHEYIVRNETGEEIQFWISGTNNVVDVSPDQGVNETPIDLGIQKSLDFEQKKREIEKRSINFQLFSSFGNNYVIKELPINVLKTYNIPINKYQTLVYDVSYQSGSKVCTLKSNFCVENNTELPLYVGIRDGLRIEVLPQILQKGTKMSIPLKYCGKSLVISPDPDKYKWTDAIDLFELSQNHKKEIHEGKQEEVCLLDRVLECTSKMKRNYSFDNNTLLEVDSSSHSSSPSQSEDDTDTLEDNMYVSETHVIRKCHLPFFLSVKIVAEDDSHFYAQRFSVSIKPPLVFINSLSVPIKFWLFNIKNSESLDEGSLVRGDKATLHCLDPRNQEVGMSMKINGFDISTVVNIAGNSNELATVIPLLQISNSVKMKKRPLLVSVDYLLEDNHSELTFYVNYWIVNKTNLRLLFKNPTLGAKGGSLPGQDKSDVKNWNIEERGKDPSRWFERDEQKIKQLSSPLMHNADSLKVRVGKSPWSNTIALKKNNDEGILEISDGKRCFVFGFTVSAAPGQFWRTKILKLVNKHVLVNATARTLHYKQPNTCHVYTLRPGQQTYFHWPSKDAPKLLCVKYEGNDYPYFSGSFQIIDVSLFECKLKNVARREVVHGSPVGEERLGVQTTTQHMTTAVIFRGERECPLYLLRNNTPQVFEIRQKDAIRDRTSPTVLPPHYEVAYAWSEPYLDNKKIIFGIKEYDSENPLEYSIDKISSNLEPIVIYSKNAQQIRKTVLSPKVYYEGITKVFEVSILTNEQKNNKNTKMILNKKESQKSSVVLPVNKISKTLSVSLPGFGLSILSDTPHEIMNLFLETVTLEHKQGSLEETLDLKIKNVQVDNQLFNTPFPIVLVPVVIDKKTNFLHFSFNKSTTHKNINYYNYFQVHLQNFELRVDEAFFTHLLHAVGPLQDYLSSKTSVEDVVQQNEMQQINLKSDMVYFKKFWIGPVQVTLSYAACSWGAKKLEGNSIGKVIKIIGKFSDLEKAPLILKALYLPNPFMGRSDFVNCLKRYYKKVILQQYHSVLGSLTIIGNPINTLQNMGGRSSEKGCRGFFRSLFSSPQKPPHDESRVQVFHPGNRPLKGVTGVVIDQKGVRKEVDVRSLGSGFTGVITKPVAQLVAPKLGYNKMETLKGVRIRSPRYIDRSGIVSDFNGAESEGQEILMTLEDGSFRHETCLYHFPNLEMASENDNLFILASNKHFFCLKRNGQFGRVSKEWVIDLEDLRSMGIDTRGVVFICSAKKSILGIETNYTDKKERPLVHHFPLPLFNMALFTYFKLVEIHKNTQKIEKRVSVKREFSTTQHINL